MNREYFGFELEKVLQKLKLNITYTINETEDMYNFLYITKENSNFIFNVNLSMINEQKLNTFLYHEIYHIKQYINEFPMLVMTKENQKYSIIQKIITDLYVTKQLIQDGCYLEAHDLFEYRINNAYNNIMVLDTDEDIYRIAYILAEFEIFFKNKSNKVLLELKERWISGIVKEMYDIIIEGYKVSDIESLYRRLITKIDKNTNVSLFGNSILII